MTNKLPPTILIALIALATIFGVELLYRAISTRNDLVEALDRHSEALERADKSNRKLTKQYKRYTWELKECAIRVR